MLKQPICGDKNCGHEIDAHHKEYVSSGDLSAPGTREPQFFACLASFCSCKKYVPPTK